MPPIRNANLGKLLEQVDMDAAFGTVFNGSSNVNVFCPFHESEESSTSASCSVSRDGFFVCKSCGAKGDVFDFYAKRAGVDRDEAKHQLVPAKEPAVSTTKGGGSGGKPSKKRLDMDTVAMCQIMLQDNGYFLSYLHEERGIDDDTIQRFKLGCDERRITIPIFDDDGEVVNIRRYMPHAQSGPKMVSYGEGYGRPRMFPIEVLQQTNHTDWLILCEGEWDCMLLNQHGLPAICVTSGVATWESSFTAMLADRNVVIIYDVNDKKDDLGQRVAWERARVLRSAGANIKVVQLPLPDNYVGGDITDWFVKEGHTATELEELIANTPVFDIPTQDDVAGGGVGEGDTGIMLAPSANGQLPALMGNANPVTLNAASMATHYYQRIQLTCIVAGKAMAPYLPPKHISVEVLRMDGSTETTERVFDPWDGAILGLIQCSEQTLKGFIRALLGIPKKAPMRVTVLDTFNIEEVYLIPSVTHEGDQGPYVLRKCFYVGHGLETNRTYTFVGYTLPDPKSQAATHILTAAIPAETDIDTFRLSDEDAQLLAATFRPVGEQSVGDKCNEIAENIAEHVTHIYGRPDLHTAVDLVFHSPLGFAFDGNYVRKGWLEILILGDTRTGKGFVTEGLCQHYRVGEVVSGENITLAGLVGGVQRVGDRWTLVWGKIPLADKRLIVMDECGSLSQSDIGRLSRIRSEGVAEITKIISEKTTARTRLIWLANPRMPQDGTKRLMVDYNFGIEAVPELIGAAEDVARFDYAFIVSHNEVPSDVINIEHQVTTTLKYTSELCSKLVMWMWSRTPDQIHFTPAATKMVMLAARELAKQFTAKIALIQGEDVRFKLARIAVACAGRTFSTDDFQNVKVTDEHVQFAYNFLHHIYSRPSCGYDRMSSSERERSNLRDPENVRAVLAEAGDNLPDLVEGLLEHRQVTIRDLADYAGIDTWAAKSLISGLVRERALVKEYSWYVKRPAFKEFLVQLKCEMRPDTNLTLADPDETTEVTDG